MPGAEPWRQVAGRAHGGARPAHRNATRALTRSGRPDEVPLESLAPDPFARLTLALMRWHFQTFAAPESQGWLTALRLATGQVGPRAAGPLCYDLVALVQALRAARTSSFRYNPEGCDCCRIWLTPEERQLMRLIDALRGGRTGKARTLVQLLCDGSPDRDLIAVAEVHLRRHAPEFVRATNEHSAGSCPASS